MSLVDQATGTIRKLWSADRTAFRDHLLRLDEESRRLRFGTPVADSFIEDYANAAFRLDTIVFAYFEEHQIRAAAELRGLSFAFTPAAEAAITVETAWRNRGLASRLLDRLLVSAQNRNVSQIYMICLRENGAMQHVAQKFGARLRFEQDEVVGKLDPSWPTPASLIQEGWQDANGFVTAVIEWPQ
ncbi:MAG: GNAT family N-acetyltransferase [Rhizobiales bacterium]|nr:GNAT family N-acetyltransferase [Hyphomicrobiales bacterium]